MPIQSRLAGIPGAELTRVKAGTGRWLFRVFMRRRGEVAWTNMSALLGSDWVASIPSASIGTPDSPVRQFVVHFIRQSNGRSLAPGMSQDPFNQVAGAFKPFIHPDTEIYVEAANLVKTAADSTAVWRRAHTGVIISDAWPEQDVVVTCNSPDWIIEDSDIEEEEERGAPDPGTPLDDEAQGLIDRWVDDPVTVLAPDGAGIGVGPYKPAVGKVGAQIRTLAGRQAWDARYLWDQASGAEQYTLYDPPRDKTTPDLILSAGDVRAVNELAESSDSIRNDFVYIFVDESGRQVTRSYQTVYPAGSPSYRRRFMRIVDTEVVKTVEQADTILQHASNDISKPLAQKRVRLNYCPWLQIHDLLQFPADDIRFDTSTVWAVVGGNHSVTADDRYTEVDLRGGGPVGQFERWKVREATSVPDDLEARSLYDFREGEQQPDGSLAPTWRRGPLVSSVRGAAMVFPLPERADHWIEMLGGEDSLGTVHRSKLALLRTDSIIIPPAPQGSYSIAHVEPRDGMLRPGRVWRKILHGTPPEVRVQTLDFVENVGGTESTAHIEMIDPRGVLAEMNYYLTIVGVQTGPFVASLVAPLTWEFTYALHPDHPVGVTFAGERNDGQPDWVYGPLFGDTNKVPDKPDVRLVLGSGAARTAYVDSPDTDAASQLYRLVTAGVEGPDVAIVPRGADPRYGSFAITAVEGAQLRYHVYAKNAAGVISEDYFDLRVDAYVPPGEYGPPALDVQAVASATNYTIYWGGDSVTLSINDGGSYGAPPASPFVVARPAAGASPLQYTFRAERNGLPVTNSVSIQPLGADTVTPNLTVTPIYADNYTSSYSAAATNPRTGVALGTVLAKLQGCTGYAPGGTPTYADGDTVTMSAGSVLIVNRPVHGAPAGSVAFTATITTVGEMYGGSEVVVHTIPSVQALGEAVRAVFSTVDADTEKLTLVPIPGATITSIQTSTKQGTGAQSGWTTLSPPYETTVDLIEKHASFIYYRVYNGAQVIQEGVHSFDLGDVADVSISSVTPNGGGTGTASVVVKGDSDVAIGLGGVKYSLAGGTLTSATVASDRSATFNVAQSTAVQVLEVWGYNSGGVQGPVARADVPAGSPLVLSANAAYDAYDAAVTARFNDFSWSGTGAGRYRVSGGTPVLFDVNSDRVGTFTVTPRSTTADLLVEIAGSTQAGAWGAWFPLTIEQYVPPAPSLLTAVLSVDDTGAAGNDVYTLTVTGTSMSGFDLDAQFYRAGVLASTQTFALASDTANVLEWTNVGAGDGVSQQHHAVAQMYDSSTGINYGSPVPSRSVPSIV